MACHLFLKGHEFHITVAVKHYPKNQLIRKELNFWWNDKYRQISGGHNYYASCKGFANDYEHMTMKEFRFWWNEVYRNMPEGGHNYYANCKGFSDDDDPLTQEYLKNWWNKVYRELSGGHNYY